MARIVIIMLVFLTLATSVTPAFEFFRMAHQWPAGYCTKPRSSCQRNPRPSTFTIHGLWPSNFSNAVFKCPGASYKQFSAQEFQFLDAVWPNLQSVGASADQSFWRREWTNHGTCCSPPRTQRSYFTLAVILHARADLLQLLRNVGITPGNSYDFNHLNSSITAAITKLPDLTCATRVVHPHMGVLQLYEVVLCYDNNAHALMDCPPTKYVDATRQYPRSSSCLVNGNNGQIYFPN